MITMGPSFSPHPGAMQQHPGAPPGHPMAPGMAHSASQPGAQPGGMSHQLVGHMGVSTPGGQMNPAALMGGMTPGAGGPNAHAMQHLNPAQAQMFQAQHLNPMAFAANNPAFQQQIQQQRLQQLAQQQQQQQRQLLAQQATYGNMGNMPMGVPMQPMGPNQAAQMAAMRSRMPGHPSNSHNQAVLAQQMALQQQQQQQQQAANNQMAQSGGNPNQSQMNPQMQQAQIAAAMQAQQQAAQQAQQAQPQTQQPQNPQQQQQPGQAQQQTPQQQNQAGPGANGPQNQAQAQNQTPQQNPQQQPQASPQAQQNAMQAHLAAQHHTAMMHQKQENMKGQCLIRLMQFGECLSGFPGSRGKDDLSYWNECVQRFFSPRGMFRHAFHIVKGDDHAEKQYEITYPALSRYFHTHFTSGVKKIQLNLDKPAIEKPLPQNCFFIENPKASLVYWFEGNSHLVATGTLRAHFDAEQKFELFEFITTGHEEYISRSLVIQAAKPAHNWVKEWHKVNSPDNKQSPEMSKKPKARTMKSPQNAPPDLDLPHSAVKQSVGITEAVYQFLEMVEIMGHMNPLFNFYNTRPGLRPYDALDQYVNIINTSGQNIVNGQAPGPGVPRTPSFSQFPVGASPAQANQMLPGSPHMGSPAQVQMQAPGMQLQASQQGTSSSGPSANTSPSQSNKRRRPSAVKNEDDASGSAPTPSGGSTPQVNGVQGKGKPPTPRMTKRAKGNPA